MLIMDRNIPFLPNGRKRRKTIHNSSTTTDADATAAGKTAARRTSRRRATRSMTRVGWKAGALPVELFEQIISYMPRKDIQAMRLVNHEFEEKVSKFLFNTVVVPFKHEIYDIANDVSYSFTTKKINSNQTDSRSTNSDDALILQDKGMRVFQGFGKHISRFAMSFEFDLAALTAPPIKSDQEAITSFWGIYRWPHKGYNRYSQLEGLEQTADETRTLAQALTYITNTKELALSIDSGLGWLSGPDVNFKMDDADHSRAVFGESRFAPESKECSKKPKSQFSEPPMTECFKIPELDVRQQKVYERMLRDAGYTNSKLKDAIILLAQHDDTMDTIEHLKRIKIVEEAGSSKNNEKQVMNSTTVHTREHVAHVGGSGRGPVIVPTTEEEPEQYNASLANNVRKLKTEYSDLPLKPAELTTAQKELLLETEWAQRAFMQSYAIAVIDNPNTFLNVRTLTFARIPSRHLPIISRDDFWNSLPSVSNVSLAVIPDWREVTKLATTYVEDAQLNPSNAIPMVHKLLQVQIAPRKSIKSLHFEWLCGGEEAPGIFARSRLILPAPVLIGPWQMVNLTQQPSLLYFKHLENLSVKNCWFSPHVLIRLVATHQKAPLRSLILDSVSLSAPSTRPRHHAIHHTPVPANQAVVQGLPVAPHVPPLQHHAVTVHNPQNIQNIANTITNQQQIVAAAVLHAAHQATQQAVQALQGTASQIPLSGRSENWLNYLLPPRKHSWADVIDIITPGENLSEMRYAHDARSLAPDQRQPSNLQKIIFRSCGYVRLTLDLDQSMFDFEHLPHESTAISHLKQAYASFMMKKQDHMLGSIVPSMESQEMCTLQQAFFLNIGWDVSKPNYDQFRLQYRTDTCAAPYPGAGRFYGSLIKQHRAQPHQQAGT